MRSRSDGFTGIVRNLSSGSKRGSELPGWSPCWWSSNHSSDGKRDIVEGSKGSGPRSNEQLSSSVSSRSVSALMIEDVSMITPYSSFIQ